MMTVDPVTFEILSHRIYQITMEMGTALERVGGTVNTTQMKDYISSLYLANGDILCAGSAMVWHVPCAGTAVKAIIKRFANEEGIHPGDMFLLNDPYVAAIHQSDVYIVSPIHYQDHLVGWSATFVHVMDIGAMSPGGNSPGATEICHEGVRIAGIKLIDRGTLRKDVFDAVTNMTRQPVMVGLDLKCEIAANNVARARMQELYGQYGTELLDAFSAEMLTHTEKVLRKRLSEVPDGEWRTAGLIESGETWNVALTLTKRGDQLLFDFAGTDPQAKVGINLPYHATLGACFEAVLSTFGYDLPKNEGLLRVVDVKAPEGSVVNVSNPGPVSLNTTSGGAVTRYLANSVMSQMAARSEKWRNEVMTQGMGHRQARHAGRSQHGWYYVSTLVGLGGGGARSYADGVDSSGMETGATSSCHNIEWIEANFPVLQIFRRHVKDSAGAGKFRGGVAEETALILHDSPGESITFVALGTAGLRNGGQGLFGGYNGAPSLLVHHTDTRIRDALEKNQAPTDLAALGGSSRMLPYCSIELRENDIFFMRFGGGGGYGDPLERDPAFVQKDIQTGLVSSEAAEALYGVVLGKTFALDLVATEKKRAAMRQERISGADRAVMRAGKVAAPSAPRMSEDHPLQESLAIRKTSGKREIQCTNCSHTLCAADEDWRDKAATRRLAPTTTGPLMADLNGHFAIVQYACPSCGVLLKSETIPQVPGPVTQPTAEPVA
jgi:N-methylhydantoinase B